MYFASLASIFGHTHGLHCPRGATGLYLATRTLLAPGSKILVPALTCPAAVFPIVLAAAIPVACEADPSDYNTDLVALEDALRRVPDAKAVLAVHSFGHMLPMDRWATFCRDRGLILIEDACQALGAGWPRRPAGSWGDVSILSFGPAKHMDRGGGAVVFSSDSELIRDMGQLLLSLPHLDHPDRLQKHYRRAYFFCDFLAKHFPFTSSLRGELGRFFSTLFVHQAGAQPPPDAMALTGFLDADLPRRAALVEAYSSIPPMSALRLPKMLPGSNPWRYTLWVDGGHQRPLGDCLRHNGYPASHWYPSLARGFLPSLIPTPVADMLGEGLVNLWMDSSVTPAEATRQARVIGDYMQKHTKI